MASLIRMPQEEGAVSDSVAPPYPLERIVACVGVVRICQVAILEGEVRRIYLPRTPVNKSSADASRF
jgi:hypothetical protein